MQYILLFEAYIIKYRGCLKMKVDFYFETASFLYL